MSLRVTNKLLFKILYFFICALLGIPILSIVTSWLSPETDVWIHLWDTYLLETTLNSLWLIVAVGFCTFVLGTSLAWIITIYEFPGKSVFEWLLVLPTAIPAYVCGLVYFSVFEYEGAFDYLGRNWFGIELARLNIMNSFPGLVFCMSLSFYPYVYLLVKNAFQKQNMKYFEVARSLGWSQDKIFMRIALPMARPAIFIGVSLVLMETLSDFGTVSIFSYNTFTSVIYEVWLGFFNPLAAAQVSSILLMLTLSLFGVNYFLKRRLRYYQTQGTLRVMTVLPLLGKKKWLVLLYPLTVFILSFVIPCVILLYWVISFPEISVLEKMPSLILNTLFLGAVSGIVIMFFAIVLAYGKRLFPGVLVSLSGGIGSMGYAVPGSVIAVGIFISLRQMEINILGPLFGDYSGNSSTMLLTGSIFGLLFAYTVRFMTIGYNAVNVGFEKVSPSLDLAAMSLGEKFFGVFRHVHWKLMRSEFFLAAVIVMIEVMKEMPATLILRPFGYNTLATYVWELNSESLLREAALPSLMMSLTGLIPVILFVMILRTKKNKNHPFS